ncbi:MAG: pseudouridine synthase [Pseudanabaenaceae cyanobacterium]
MAQGTGSRSKAPLPDVLALHKPYGVLCQFTDEGTGHPTLKDWVSVPGVYPMGRLDRDSEGLVLLSGDGGLQHRLCHPRFGHPRTYWVQVEGIPTAAALAALTAGVDLRIAGKPHRTLPAHVHLLAAPPDVPPRVPPIRQRLTVPTAWLALTLTEGKNRQVRRMTAAVGFPTLRLVRVAIGPIALGSLQPGQWRWLAPAEVAALSPNQCKSR